MKADLTAMIRPASSPIVAAHNGFLRLLQTWGPGNREWDLLGALGGDFSDPGLRVRSRAHLLREDAGTFIYFTARMARPPYSTVLVVLEDEVDADHVDAVVTDFMASLCRAYL